MVGLVRCFDDDGNFDLEKFYLSRQKRRREEEEEDADDDDGDNGPDKLKKRPYQSRRYWGYCPEDDIILEKCQARLKNQNLGGKDSHTTRAFQLVVNQGDRSLLRLWDFQGDGMTKPLLGLMIL